MASFIENVNIVYSKLETIEAAPQYAQEASVNASASAAYKESAASSAALAQSSALSSAQSLSESIRTKDELIAMKDSFGLAVRTESASVMLDGFGRYFVQASLVPYGDVLVATVDDGDNDIDIIDGVVSDRELKRFYFTDVSLLGKTIIFKYLGSAINTPLSQYLKDTIDALELLDYKTSIDDYAISKIDDATSAIETIATQKQSDVLAYADTIYATTSLGLDTIKAEAITTVNLTKEEAITAVDTIKEKAITTVNLTKEEINSLYVYTTDQLEAVVLDSLALVDNAKQEVLELLANDLVEGISAEEFMAVFGSFSEFDTAISYESEGEVVEIDTAMFSDGMSIGEFKTFLGSFRDLDVALS